MTRRSGTVGLFVGIVLSAAAPCYPEEDGVLTVDLQEVSAFSVADKANALVFGQRGECEEQPSSDVAAYPELHSSAPIYGSIWFGRNYLKPESGSRYFFVIDESNDKPGGGYDRLYFDVDHDRDLSDETPLRQEPNPPARAEMNYSSIQSQVCFELLKVPFGSENHPVEMMPRLVIDNKGYRRVSFVATKAFMGSFVLGTQSYTAILGNTHVIEWPLNSPNAAFLLMISDNALSPWWGADSLKAYHRLDGVLYHFEAAPDASRLFVRPYQGPMGRFEVGTGARDIANGRMSGSVDSEDKAVAVGDADGLGQTEMASGCDLPVGDYSASFIMVEYGDLQIGFSNNYHADGKPRGRGRAPIRAIHIREDKPFVLDFSNKPEVLFASPAKNQRLKPGETLEVKGVLIDPALDIMIRDLGARAETPQQTETSSGRRVMNRGNPMVSLDPKVVITLQDGEKVAEGTMPFG